MLMGYGIPNLTFTIAGSSSGAAFVTDQTKLGKFRPADATRIQWLSASSPAITDYVTITATFDATINMRVAALLMPNLSAAIPDGVRVVLTASLSGTNVPLGGNAAILRTYRVSSGAIAAHWVFPSVQVSAISVTIFNDRYGAVWANSSTQPLLGVIVPAKGADFPIANDLDSTPQGGILQRQSHNNQAWPLLTQPWRNYTPNFVPIDEPHLIGPLTYQDDFETVAYSFNTSKASIIVPSYLNQYNGSVNASASPIITTATINQQRLARSFLLGLPSKPISWKRNGDRYAIGSFTMSEMPP